jgi:hypothetical protein
VPQPPFPSRMSFLPTFFVIPGRAEGASPESITTGLDAWRASL